jgi:ABC-type transport system involved in multi-copper enzyme maturation permease subunit
MIFVDLIFHYYLTIYFSTTFLLDIIWTYMIEGVTFLAIVYLISHLVKSQGALLGASIGLFVVLDLFWQIIPAAILAAFGISSGTSEYVSTTIILDYISPAGYSSLIQALLTNHLGTFVTQTINAGAFGISSISLLIAGLLWMVVPFVAAYLLAVRRD